MKGLAGNPMHTQSHAANLIPARIVPYAPCYDAETIDAGSVSEAAMEVTVLGTGSPMAPERVATGLLVTAPGCEPLLIDTCGGFELPRQLARIGQPIKRLAQCDRHAPAYGSCGRDARALHRHHPARIIYALPDTHAGIRELMAACFPEWPIHPDVQRVSPLRRASARDIGGFAVEFFATEHRVPTVAVRVTHDGRTLAFSADGVPTDGMVACARDADLFICDALCAALDGADWATRARSLMHPVAREAAEMAVAANARSLALTHLARYANPDNLLAEAREVFPGPVIVPETMADVCRMLAVWRVSLMRAASASSLRIRRLESLPTTMPMSTWNRHALPLAKVRDDVPPDLHDGGERVRAEGRAETEMARAHRDQRFQPGDQIVARCRRCRCGASCP